MKKTLTLKILLLFTLTANATLTKFWYTGYNFNGPELLTKKIESLESEITNSKDLKKVLKYIDLANKYFLEKDYTKMSSTISDAINYAESHPNSAISNFKYGLYNLLIERSHYTGHYLQSYEFIKKYINKVPTNRPEYLFIKFNRLKIIAKSIHIEQYPALEDMFALNTQFKSIEAYTSYIETVLMLNINYYEKTDIKQVLSIFDSLPHPYKEEGYLNLYFYLKSKKPELLIQSKGILQTNYLAYFRLNIGLSEYYISIKDTSQAIDCMNKAFNNIIYTGDIEVEKHYSEIYKYFKETFNSTENIPTDTFKLQPSIASDRTYASALAIRDLLDESYSEVKKEQRQNKVLLYILFTILTGLTLSFVALINLFRKLRNANIYRQWFTTVLSHDLRSPISKIADGIKEQKSNLILENELANYEYLLDDTLEMAFKTQSNKKIKFQNVSIYDLIYELLEDLKFLIEAKKLTINCAIDEKFVVSGDEMGLKVLFRNILLNAVKHNYHAGKITIMMKFDKYPKIIISNSTESNALLNNNKTTGKYIIEYFTKQNKATHFYKTENKVATVEVIFKKLVH
jgi:hypothetical protein